MRVAPGFLSLVMEAAPQINGLLGVPVLDTSEVGQSSESTILALKNEKNTKRDLLGFGHRRLADGWRLGLCDR